MISDVQREQMTNLRRELLAEMERLEREELSEGNPIAPPGVDSVRGDRIAAISREIAELDAQLVGA